MVTEPLLATSASCVLERRSVGIGDMAARYWSLTRPEISVLIGITTSTGFFLAAARTADFAWVLLLHVVVATMMVAGGAAAFNQWIEHEFDARMRRTARRPIPAGTIEPLHALRFATTLSLTGLGYLYLAAGVLPFMLALATLASYLLLYTPAKRITPLCTLIGAVPGAMPPLIGWAAARGSLSREAFVLFAIVFLWQFPHFMAIAWTHRDDYDRAGYRVLPPEPARARFVGIQTLVPTFALVPLALAPILTSGAGVLYGLAAGLLWLGFAYYAACFEQRRSTKAARRLLLASVVYLPALFVLMACAG